MEIVLDILCHADFSGRLRKTPDSPGIAAFAAEVERLRAQNPGGTLLLSAGDEFSANLWGGQPIVGAMNLLRTDAMVLGNHEFDRGPQFLEDCIAGCEFPVLCANVHKKDGAPIAGTAPYTILERQGVKIGVLGLTTEYTPYMVEKSAFEAFEMAPAAQAAHRWVPQMRAEGAEVVVALTHMPFYVEENGAISGEMHTLLGSMPGVDVCIGGHIPGDYAAVQNGTCVVKAGFDGVSLGHIRLVFSRQARRITARSCEVLHTPFIQASGTAMAAYAQKVLAPFEAYLTQPLARLEKAWPMHLAQECMLGDFLADCMRFGANTQLAYMNATSSGGCLEAGPVTMDDILRVNGFNDEIYTGTITGRQLYQLMEGVYAPQRFGNNAGLLISGFHARLDHTRPSPHKLQALCLPDGTPIGPEDEFTVATSAYMASGGNDTSFVASAVRWNNTHIRYHDAVAAWARRQGTLCVPDYPRLQETGTPENNHAPF